MTKGADRNVFLQTEARESDSSNKRDRWLQFRYENRETSQHVSQAWLPTPEENSLLSEKPVSFSFWFPIESATSFVYILARRDVARREKGQRVKILW